MSKILALKHIFQLCKSRNAQLFICFQGLQSKGNTLGIGPLKNSSCGQKRAWSVNNTPQRRRRGNDPFQFFQKLLRARDVKALIFDALELRKARAALQEKKKSS